MTDQVYTDFSQWINAYHHFSDHLFSKVKPEKWHVPAIQEEAVHQLNRIFEAPGLSRCVSVTGHGGCGKTALLQHLTENETFTKRHQIIYTSLSRELHLLDTSCIDVLFLICLSLIKALRESDIEPPSKELKQLIAPLVQKYNLTEEDIPLQARLLYRLKIDMKFRGSLRIVLKHKIDALVNLINLACKKIARNTFGCFKLDDDAIHQLKQEDVSATILSKLTDLIGYECRSEVTFIREVEKRIGDIQTIHYKPVMLKYAWTETAKRPMLLLDDLDKLPWPLLTRILHQWPAFFSQVNADTVLTLPVNILYHPLLSDEKIIGKQIILSPLALYDRENGDHTDPASLPASLMEQAILNRLNGLPVSQEALHNLILHSGGIMRHLMHIMKHACRIVIENGAASIDEAIAQKAVKAAGAVHRRFFNDADDAAIIKMVMKTNTSKGIPPEKLDCLLRQQFLIRYDGKKTGSRFDAHPCLKESFEKRVTWKTQT